MKENKKEKHAQIFMNGKYFSNITVVNRNNEPVAIITSTELITKSGFKVLFNAGEDD
ncbi:hypothetical protein [Lactiplantibacillus daowaiensis]|uniref:Prevent-host-death protein n=1 Tax=Lactiplantibacillus daowaiensis TaxID=2559918 RepID=A0ABW1RWU4_9LACO|nr:hypothetical protein [Lactiplantibacillus daowaiensis]